VGLSGLCLASLGCGRVLITDLPDALELINANIELNSKSLEGYGKVSHSHCSSGAKFYYLSE
jgi:Lysine methyltransferase